RLEELFGREWQLIAELGFSLLPRAAHVEPRTLAEPASELPVDEDRKSAIDSVRGQLIRWTHHADHRLDEAGFVRSKRQIAGRRRRQHSVNSTRGSTHGLGGGRLGCFRESRGRRGGA